MKTFLVGLLVIFLLCGAGYVGFQYLSRQSPSTETSKSISVSLSGKLLEGKGSDYSYILIDGAGKTTGIATQEVQLGKYVNKTVEITGTYSGTTLYANSVTETK